MNEDHRSGDGSTEHTPDTTGAPGDYAEPSSTADERREETGSRAQADTRRDQAQRSELQQHLLSQTTWLRFLHIVLFLILWGISRIIIGVVIVLQFFWVLFTGERNPRLSEVGQSFATYSYELVLYLTFASDRRPFPFADWPVGPPAGGEAPVGRAREP